MHEAQANRNGRRRFQRDDHAEHAAGETQCLDRGDGICRHYQTDSHLCAIYDKRPQICRVEDQYLLNYQSQYSWQEFIALNQAACLILNKL
nr:YkgJ family cysteine cluster protein [Escherichia coli]